MAENDEPIEDQVQGIEQRLESLEAETEPLRQQIQMQEIVIREYRQALSNATHHNAILTAQLKIATQPTD